jgi:hypothetical protein
MDNIPFELILVLIFFGLPALGRLLQRLANPQQGEPETEAPPAPRAARPQPRPAATRRSMTAPPARPRDASIEERVWTSPREAPPGLRQAARRRPPTRPAVQLTRANLRQAILMQEILGPPMGSREPDRRTRPGRS